MFDHLVHTADFFAGRRYVELELDEIEALEGAVHSSPKSHRYHDVASGIDSPPFEIRKWESWQGAMMRAAAIAKFVCRFMVIGQAEKPVERANLFLEFLCHNPSELPDVSLHCFDHVWQRLTDGLRADFKATDLKGPLATALKAENISEIDARFKRQFQMMADTGGSSLDLCDALATLEWVEFLEPHLRSDSKGTVFENQAGFIDLRGVTEDEWLTDPGWTVARGLIFLRTPYPILVRQLADQGVENWPFIRELDLPIFTQHQGRDWRSVTSRKETSHGDFYVYGSTPRDKGRRDRLTRIEAGWNHEKGGGVGITVEALPLNFTGKLVLFPPKAAAEAEAQAEMG
jgi:hypothetical protein